MTIKQHGGVFGRNPKFNSVEVESLSIAGNAFPDASTILVDGDIGTSVQGYDADTAKYDDATANFTGTLQNGGSDVVVDTDIGSTVQAFDAGLASIAGLTTAADKMIYATASDTYAVTDITSAGRAILDDADASAQRTTLGLGTIATQDADNVDIDGGAIDGAAIGANSASTGAFTTLSASSTATFSNLTASTALALDANKDVVSVTNTGSGNNVLATSPTLTTPNIGAATGSSLVLGDSDGSTSILQSKLPSGSQPVYYCQHHSTADANWYMIRFFNGDGSSGGGILQNTSTGVINYATTSDYRLKTDVIGLDNAVDRLKQLKPVRFKWLAAPGGRAVDGFIAHEVADIVPEAIHGEKDAVDENGDIDPQGIDQAKLVPLLTAAMQELLVENKSLRDRVQRLEEQVLNIEMGLQAS